MFGFLRRGKEPEPDLPADGSPPASVSVPGGPDFVYEDHIDRYQGFPYLRWKDVWDWIDLLPEGARDGAWAACTRGWRLHLARGLGPGYRATEGKTAAVIAPVDDAGARELVALMEKTASRIRRVLVGLGEDEGASPGKELLIVFGDRDDYYRFVSRFYPERGEFAFSSGMHINSEGASFYVTTLIHPHAIAPIVAHEMTHGFVSHLPLPLWLNEGLAVNTEQRVAGAVPPLHTPVEMRARHLKFWGAREIRQFWSGDSFHRPDEGNELSYDLARILVEQLGGDWPRFVAFTRSANRSDAGAQAFQEHYSARLGEMVCAILERDYGPEFEPVPRPAKSR